MEELRDKIKEILRSMDLGYPYQMSDYATSREQELEYEREGLQEVDDITDQLMQLIQAERTKAKEEGRQEMISFYSPKLKEYQEEITELRNDNFELKQSLAKEKGTE